MTCCHLYLAGSADKVHTARPSRSCSPVVDFVAAVSIQIPPVPIGRNRGALVARGGHCTERIW
jgi:hypothetical protein